MQRLHGVVANDAGVDFVMAFIDRVARPDDHLVAARQLRTLIDTTPRLPDFLGPIDRLLLRAGSRLAPIVPTPRHAARPSTYAEHRRSSRRSGRTGRARNATSPDSEAPGGIRNVNLLGEAVLGRREAGARLAQLQSLLHQPDVDYVSVKLSSVPGPAKPLGPRRISQRRPLTDSPN